MAMECCLLLRAIAFELTEPSLIEPAIYERAMARHG
jgi:hypothetical protein